MGSNIVHGLKEADVPLLGGFEELEGSILWVDLGVGVGLGVGISKRDIVLVSIAMTPSSKLFFLWKAVLMTSIPNLAPHKLPMR